MHFIWSYEKMWRNFLNFHGRTSRADYWRAVAVNFGVYLILAYAGSNSGAAQLIYMLYLIAAIVPSLAMGVRRLHDRGSSTWWILLALIPIAGSIALLVMMLRPGDLGANRYGPAPIAGPGVIGS